MSKKNTAKKQAGDIKVSQNPPSQELLNQKIREIAQELYKKRGEVPGHELEDWLEAERIVKKEA